MFDINRARKIFAKLMVKHANTGSEIQLNRAFTVFNITMKELEEKR